MLFIASSSFPANAQKNSLGYGVTACSEFVATYEPRQMTAVYAWVGGFFTGANMATIGTSARYRDVNGLDPASVITRLLDHCTRNPQNAVLHAVQQIYGSAPLIASKAAKPVGAR
jgi:hypothetical protein